MLTANKECPICQNHHDSSLPSCAQSNSSTSALLTPINQSPTNFVATENLETLKNILKASALHNDIKTLYQTYIKIADYFSNIKDFDQALAYFHKAELLQPNTTTHNLKEIINIYCKQARLDKTLRHIRQLAQLYVNNRETQEAKEFFENLISSYPPNVDWLHETLLILDSFKLTSNLNLSATAQEYIEKALFAHQVELHVSVVTDDSDENIPLINDLIEEELSPFDSNQLKPPQNKNGFNPLSKPLVSNLEDTSFPTFDPNNQPSTNEHPSLSSGDNLKLVFPVDNPIPTFEAKFITPKEIPSLSAPTLVKRTTGSLNIPINSELSESQTKLSFSIRNTGSFRPIERPNFNDLAVMIVDDDVAVRELIVELLNDVGCRVIEAIDGEEAIEKLNDSAPNFIISDVSMPRKNGYELFEYLQTNEKFSDIPFIFLTGYGEATQKLQALQEGVEDYWLKPFDIEELNIRLRRMLQKARLAGDVRGKLSEMPLPDLLQSLASGNKSGVLHLSRSGRYGIIYIDQGRITDAEFEDLVGKTAIYCLVNWCMDGGNFNFHSQSIDRNMAIKQSIQGILMEAMRRRDEEMRLIEQLPPGEVFMSVNTEDNPEFFSADFSDETMRILQLFDGTHPLSECLHCLQGDLETIQTVVALNKAGLLRIVDFGLE